MNNRGRAVMTAIVNELALVLGALLETPATVAPGGAPDGSHWRADLACEGGLRGRVALALDCAGLEVLGRVTGAGDTTGDPVAAALREALAQAIGAVEGQAVSTGIMWKIDDLSRHDTAPSAAPVATWAIAAAALPSPLRVAVFGVPQSADGDDDGAEQPEEEDAASRIDVILDIDLPVVVRFGRTEMPIRLLTQLGPGSVLDLGRSPDDPVEVLVSDRVVAHGEVVIVGGHYGIRIVDVVSPSERVRTMEA
jgi:flagellar motor switch protein FliN/FliY